MQKYLKPSVFILSTIPFLVILYKIFLNKLGPEPVKEITHFTGEWTLIFLCLTLSMSPLKRLTNLSVWVSFRRTLGLFVFFYATLHLLTYIGLDYRFNWPPILEDVAAKGSKSNHAAKPMNIYFFFTTSSNIGCQSNL